MTAKCKREADIQASIMIALSREGCLVFRNNTGVLLDRRGVPVRFGLCVGSSDLIGIAPDGVFFAIECKAKGGRTTQEQNFFIEAVQKHGGRAGVARCVEDALKIALQHVV